MLTPEQGQFDFWIGDWDVSTADGKPAGTNTVEKILGGCVLRESWVGASGVRGHSFSAWNAKTKRWHQTWVDDRGTVLVLEGELAGNTMVLASAPARRHIDRISWEPLPGGRVRQVWDVSEDDGKTWAVDFDGLYVRAAR